MTIPTLEQYWYSEREIYEPENCSDYTDGSESESEAWTGVFKL